MEGYRSERTPGFKLGLAIIVGFLIFLVPPGATLIGMLTAAWSADQDPGLDELPHEKRG